MALSNDSKSSSRSNAAWAARYAGQARRVTPAADETQRRGATRSAATSSAYRMAAQRAALQQQRPAATPWYERFKTAQGAAQAVNGAIAGAGNAFNQGVAGVKKWFNESNPIGAINNIPNWLKQYGNVTPWMVGNILPGMSAINGQQYLMAPNAPLMPPKGGNFGFDADASRRQHDVMTYGVPQGPRGRYGYSTPATRTQDINTLVGPPYIIPELPTQPDTGGGGGGGYYPWPDYGGGGGGGGYEGPAASFYNQLMNWKVLEIKGG